jgi:regulator of Ty1 transposition protein 103
LENSASSDAIVREKIARLPPDVSEVVHLEKLKSAKEGAELMEKVIIYTFLYTA